MRKWSDELIALSREYFKYDDVNVKSINGNFGILNVISKKLYTISIFDTDIILTYNSIDEMINAGWAVD